MTYLDHGATSFPKPVQVRRAVHKALEGCANPGRGGYGAAMEAAKTVYGCREAAARLFESAPEQVVFTANCTHGLNIAIETLVKPGSRVVVSGFEHNAVTRPLYARDVRLTVAGRRLFDWSDTLDSFAAALKSGADAAVFTHVSNVFGYILPVEELAALCRSAGVPFILDAAQSAGALPVSLKKLGADYIAMPGHKGLLGPQGTGILLCGSLPKPLLHGGTGSASRLQRMPDFLPDRAEAGTLNVPGIAGLAAGIRRVAQEGTAAIAHRERRQALRCAEALKSRGFRVFSGENQGGTVSFVGKTDCEELAAALAQQGIAVRGGLHCAPLAHESAGTQDTGTVRVSFGYNACDAQTRQFLQGLDRVRL